MSKDEAPARKQTLREALEATIADYNKSRWRAECTECVGTGCSQTEAPCSACGGSGNVPGSEWRDTPQAAMADHRPATRLEALQAQPVGEEALTRAAKALYKAYEETTDEHVEQVWNYASHPDADVRAIWSETVVEMMQWAQKTLDAAALTASPPVVEREAIDVVDRARQIAQESYDAIRPTGGKFWGELDDMTQTLAIVAARDAILALTPVEKGITTDDTPVEGMGETEAAFRAGYAQGEAGSDVDIDFEWAHYSKALSTPVAQGDEVREALRAAHAIFEQATDFYTARNGRRMSIEGDDGEKCWIVPFEVFEELRHALAILTKGARDAG